MILPRRPMTPWIHGASEAIERGSVKRMISCTAPMGRAYSSLPSEKTTSCWEVKSDMSVRTSAERPVILSDLVGRGKAHDEARAAAVQRRLERDAAVVRVRHGADDRQTEAGGAGAVALAAEEALEDLLVQLERDARAVVLHGEDDLAVDPLDARLHGGPGVGVAQRVLHQVE